MSLRWSSDIEELDWQALAALYRAAPLGDKRPEGLRTAFGHSMFRFIVYDGAALVGAGRALANGVDCAYICVIAVMPSHPGIGLGRQLVERLVQAARGHRKIILYAVPGKEGFYEKLGFARMNTAMAIFQNQAQATADGYLQGRPAESAA